MTYAELLGFSMRGMEREGQNMQLKALRMNAKNCFSMQLENKLFRQWSIEIYFALLENKGEVG